MDVCYLIWTLLQPFEAVQTVTIGVIYGQGSWDEIQGKDTPSHWYAVTSGGQNPVLLVPMTPVPTLMPTACPCHPPAPSQPLLGVQRVRLGEGAGVMGAALHPTGPGLWGQSVWAAISGCCHDLISGATAGGGPLPLHCIPFGAGTAPGVRLLRAVTCVSPLQ